MDPEESVFEPILFQEASGKVGQSGRTKRQGDFENLGPTLEPFQVLSPAERHAIDHSQRFE
jgi:hypothetical protein